MVIFAETPKISRQRALGHNMVHICIVGVIKGIYDSMVVIQPSVVA